MPAPLLWSSILWPTSVRFQPKFANTVGPIAFSGLQQRISSNAGYWEAELDFTVIDRDQVLEWRAMVTSMEGGINDVIIGVYDDRQAPYPAGIDGNVDGIPFGDGALFSDGSGFSQSGIDVELENDLGMGERSAVLKINSAGTIRRGMYFSINHRLYQITGNPPVVSGSNVSLTFWPPARVDTAAGTRVKFDRPDCLMTVMEQDSGGLELSGSPAPYFGQPSLTLRESFNGL